MVDSVEKNRRATTSMAWLDAKVGWAWHVHPNTLALVASATCIALSFFPPRQYSELMEEPNFMFGHLSTLAFILGCTLAFMLGVKFFSRPLNERQHTLAKQQISTPFSAGSVVPSALAIFSALIGTGTAIEFIGNPALFFAALATGSAEYARGDAVESALDGGFSVLTLLPIGLPVLIWCIFCTFCNESTKTSKRLVGVSACIYAICLVLTLQRNLLIPFLVCTFILLSGLKWHARGISPQRAINIAGLSAAFVIALFSIIAYFRGGDAASPLTVLTGYIPASINRLAAALDSDLIPAISGEPYYSFRFFWHPPLIRRFLPIDELGRSWGLSIPETGIEGWTQEFASVSDAALNPSYIWATAYGYTFYDFGWWSLIYFFGLGLLAHRAWISFNQKGAPGIIFYPYIATSILLWPTDNFMALPQIWLFGGFISVLYWGPGMARKLTAPRKVRRSTLASQGKTLTSGLSAAPQKVQNKE